MCMKKVKGILLSMLLITSMGITGCGGSSKEQSGNNDNVVVNDELLSDAGVPDDVVEDDQFDFDEIFGEYVDQIKVLGSVYNVYENGAYITEVNEAYSEIQKEVEVDGIKYQVIGLKDVHSDWDKFEIPSNIKYILSGAFQYSKIKSIVIPDTVEYISGDDTFLGSEIESVSFPKDIKTDKEFSMFAECKNIKDVKFPSGVEVIEDFSKSGITNISIPSSVHTIKRGAFYNCTELIEVVIPDSVITIKEAAFEGCTSLKKLNIPNSVQTLALNLGVHSAIEELIIPDSVTNYIVSTISDMPNLKTIKFSNSNTEICYELHSCPNLELIVFPDGIQDAENFFFEDDEHRNVITIQVERDTVDYYKQVFSDCNVIAKE